MLKIGKMIKFFFPLMKYSIYCYKKKWLLTTYLFLFFSFFNFQNDKFLQYVQTLVSRVSKGIGCISSVFFTHLVQNVNLCKSGRIFLILHSLHPQPFDGLQFWSIELNLATIIFSHSVSGIYLFSYILPDARRVRHFIL